MALNRQIWYSSLPTKDETSAESTATSRIRIMYTRLLGLVYTLKQSRKSLRIFNKKIADFQQFKFFTKLKTFKTHF